MELIRIIYTSTAVREYAAADLDDILASSARNNAGHAADGSDRVTGMLLYAGGNFMQILEGGKEAVEATFQRLEKDPRHKDIFVIERGPIEQRDFAAWNMGFRRIGQAELDSHPAFAPFFRHGFEARRLCAEPGMALDMLIEFAANQRA